MSTSTEKHWAIKDIAKLWGLSYSKIRDIFAAEDGVLRLGSGRKTLLRIPQSVLDRVHANRSSIYNLTHDGSTHLPAAQPNLPPPPQGTSLAALRLRDLGVRGVPRPNRTRKPPDPKLGVRPEDGGRVELGQKGGRDDQ